MTLMGKLSKPKAYLVTFLKWGLFGLLIGAWGGLLGAAFHHALHFVTHLRAEHSWLIFLLPVAGLLSVGIYTLFRQRSNRGTNEVIDAVLSGGDVRYVYVERICIAKDGKFEEYESSSNMQIYAWYVWEKGFEGETTLRWISNKKSLHKAVKALILDFDHTLFNTDADREVRKNSKVKDWDLIFSKISEYKLYDGWREVFNTAKTKGVKIAIISTAKKELIQRTLKHFQLDCDVIIGWQRCYQKPNPKLVEMALKKLQVSKEEVVSIGDSVLDKQMSINCEVRFIGAIWDCEKEESLAELQRGITISSPLEIIDIL